MRESLIVLSTSVMLGVACRTVAPGAARGLYDAQGWTEQGVLLQGTFATADLKGFDYRGATLGGEALDRVRIEQGGLVAERRGTTLRGAELAGATLRAWTTAGREVPFRIAGAVNANDSSVKNPYTGDLWDATGETWLYDLWQVGAGSPACEKDKWGIARAVPVAAVFDARGNREESTALFTFGCTKGVIAKCIRWRYKPWVSFPGTDMRAMHWSCTRMARADYCGDGRPHTHEGTLIHIWDEPAPSIQEYGSRDPTMLFEAGWNAAGAVCLSKERWEDIRADICPGHLYAPRFLPGGGVEAAQGSVCGDAQGALRFDPNVHLFNESRIERYVP